jgi:hypothetical protein
LIDFREETSWVHQLRWCCVRPCDSGFDAVLFERSADVGGLWGYDNPETSKVFNTVGRCRLTLSNPR